MFCRDCGVKIPSEAKFCYKCGLQIIKDETVIDSQQSVDSEQSTLIIRSSGINSDSFTINSEQEEQILRDDLRKMKKENLAALISILAIIGIVIMVGIIQESDNANTLLPKTEVSNNENTQPKAIDGSDTELVSETNQIITRLQSQYRTYWTECASRPIIPIPGYLFCFYPVIETCNVSFFDSYYYAENAVENGEIVDLGDVWYGEDAETGYGVVVSAPSYEDSCFVDAMVGLGLQDWWVSN